LETGRPSAAPGGPSLKSWQNFRWHQTGRFAYPPRLILFNNQATGNKVKTGQTALTTLCSRVPLRF